MNPSFHQQVVRSFAPAICKHSLDLVQEIRTSAAAGKGHGREFVCEDMTSRLAYKTMAMLIETVMDTAVEKDLFLDMVELVDKCDELLCARFSAPWKLITPLYNLTSDGKLLRDTLKDGRERIRFQLCERMKLHADPNNNINSGSKKLALMDKLIEEHFLDPIKTPISDIIDELVNFLTAGWDTTMWTASYALLLLGNYPDVQEKVHQEIMSVIPDIKNISMADTFNLKYLDCVLNETMRMYPVVTFFGRKAECDITVTIDDVTEVIPEGMDLIVDTDILHRDPRYWTDPNKFIPERFLPENSAGRDPYAFLPFSAGPRNCIGKTFGIMEDKIILATIVHAFRVRSLDTLDKVAIKSNGISKKAKYPLRFLLEPRE